MAPVQQKAEFKDLPVEVSCRILVFAVANPISWTTYRSLTVVSSTMQALAYDACLPYLPVVIHTQRQFDSFCMLLASHPTTVGPRVREIWLIANIKANVECTMGRNILQTCTLITHLACTINLLKTLASSPFINHNLKHLTLAESIIPWSWLLKQPAGRQLFAQLTHFRAQSGTHFVIPDFCFASLTHLSFSCHELTFGSTDTSPFDAVRFPVLQQIVPSIPYMICRLQDPKALNKQGLSIDPRVNVVLCPKKWKEADIWVAASYGKEDLWAGARSGIYLQRSRAFTQEFPKYDVEDYEFGGETGL